jgi:Heparinase II/III-like protein/Heparinase II/III N-terminus
MSWDELRMRAGQEVAKRHDILLYRFGVDPVGGLPAPKSSGRFFFAPDELPEIIATIQNELPGDAERIVTDAERIRRRRFDLLGFHDLDFGPAVDWSLDPVHGKHAPRKPWYQIRYLDFAEVGDHKIVWELNRHQFLVTLAKAYWLTRDQRFVDDLLALWYSWIEDNPYPIGMNWASSLEVAFRSLSWLWVRYLLLDCPAAPARFGEDLMRAVALSGRHIERYLSTYFAPNTHLLGEGVALFFIGVLYPQLPRALRWKRQGWEIVLEEARRQVQPDGMHFEQSTYYHVYALDFFLHARILAAANGVPIPPEFDQTIQQMLDALRLLSQAGALPRFGDDDGGRLFDGRRNCPEHMLDPLSTGAVLYRRPDFRRSAGGYREETVWVLGPRSAREFHALSPAAPKAESVALCSSGIYGMTGPREQLFIDAGPQGFLTAGHGHADALSIQLAARGRTLLIDPGAFCYIDPNGQRNRFRGTAAHNTLCVDGLDQADPAGPFSWGRLTKTKTETWVTGETFDLFAGSHEGYQRLAQPITHRRWVFGLKSRFWMVRDIAAGQGSHRFDLSWHLAPDSGLSILPAAGHDWSQSVSRGDWSPAYGRKQPISKLRFTLEGAAPVEFALLIIPEGDEPGTFERIGDSKVRAYHYRTQQESHFMFFPDHPAPWCLGEWASDAQFLYVHAPAEGSRRFILTYGSYVESAQKRLVNLSEPVPSYETVLMP